MDQSTSSSPARHEATDALPCDPPPVRPRRLGARDAHRLLGALGVLADYEGAIKCALEATEGDERDHARVCRALRFLVDGSSAPAQGPGATLER